MSINLKGMGRNNPELLDEITIKELPFPWNKWVDGKGGYLEVHELPNSILDSAMHKGFAGYMGDQIDAAELRLAER